MCGARWDERDSSKVWSFNDVVLVGEMWRAGMVQVRVRRTMVVRHVI